MNSWPRLSRRNQPAPGPVAPEPIPAAENRIAWSSGDSLRMADVIALHWPAGEPVTPETARSVSAVYACTRVVASVSDRR